MPCATFLQVPVPQPVGAHFSQVPLQVSSSPESTEVHFPFFPVWSHEVHEPVQAALQHTPSTQNPLAHLAEVAQVWPSAVKHSPFPLHAVPAALQGRVAMGSCLPIDTFTHVPTPFTTEHFSQVPWQAVWQQIPSTQNPLIHSEAALHDRPVVETYSSALAWTIEPPPDPPAISTFPEGSNVRVCPFRLCFGLPVTFHVPNDGSYTSAELFLPPPAMRTLPFLSRMAGG